MSSQPPTSSDSGMSRRMKRSLVILAILAMMAALVGTEILLVYGLY